MRDLSLARAAWSRIPLLGMGDTLGCADPELNCKALMLFRLIPRLIKWVMWFSFTYIQTSCLFSDLLMAVLSWRAGVNNSLASYEEQGMGAVMGDEGLAWYWLSHPGWQDHSQAGKSAGLFWQRLSPLMSTHSWESFWKGVLDSSVASNKMIHYVSVCTLCFSVLSVFFPCSGKSGALCSRGAMSWSQEQPVWLCWWWWGQEQY